MTRVFSALAALVFAAACASPQTSTEPAAVAKAGKDATVSHKSDSDEYITGSRLPRKPSQNTEGTRGASPAEMRRYEPPQRGPVTN